MNSTNNIQSKRIVSDTVLRAIRELYPSISEERVQTLGQLYQDFIEPITSETVREMYPEMSEERAEAIVEGIQSFTHQKDLVMEKFQQIYRKNREAEAKRVRLNSTVPNRPVSNDVIQIIREQYPDATEERVQMLARMYQDLIDPTEKVETPFTPAAVRRVYPGTSEEQASAIIEGVESLIHPKEKIGDTLTVEMVQQMYPNNTEEQSRRVVLGYQRLNSPLQTEAPKEYVKK